MKSSALVLNAVILALQMSGQAAAPPAKSRTPKLNLQTLSTRADRVTGGDVLVSIAAPAGAPAARPEVRLNGRDISDAFRQQRGSLVGLVTGLVDGRNELKVSAWGVRDQVLALANYPATGPVISGPHIEPFVCQTDTFKLPDGSTLGVASDADCSAPTKVQYVYMPYDGKDLQPLPNTRALPGNVATITTT